MDWAVQVPYTLFALRQSPNRDTGISPYEMVYGFNVRTPLDALYHCRVEEKEVDLNASEWVDVVQERLDLVRDVASRRMKEAVVQRKKACSKIRMFEKGDMRVPSLCHKLQESWTGPFEVVERLNRVNYKVKESDGKSRVKVVHINNLKLYVAREECVNRLTVVASEEKDVVALAKRSEEYVEEDIRELMRMYCQRFPVRQIPYRLRLRLRRPPPLLRFLTGCLQNYTKV